MVKMRLHNLYRLLLLSVLLAQGMLPRAQVTALQTATAPSGELMDVWFLNVGQGNCILIKLPSGKFMLYDAGSTSKFVNRSAIAGSIQKLTNGNEITTIFLSHTDADHVNIIPHITVAQKPLFVHFSGNESDYKKHIGDWLDFPNWVCKKISYPFQYSNVKPLTNAEMDADTLVEVYIMSVNAAPTANGKSLVIMIEYNDVQVLLSGDATGTTEQWIMKTWDQASLKSTVYCFAHHGSNHSNLPTFLNMVKPNICIASASGKHLGYGHPRCSVFDIVKPMLDSAGSPNVTVQQHSIRCANGKNGYQTLTTKRGIFVTATQGLIHFQTDGVNYKVIVDRL
jgi:competence protein ComEC